MLATSDSSTVHFPKSYSVCDSLISDSVIVALTISNTGELYICSIVILHNYIIYTCFETITVTGTFNTLPVSKTSVPSLKMHFWGKNFS